MMHRHGRAAASAEKAKAAAVPRPLLDTALRKTDDKKFTWGQFVAAYLSLFLVRPGADQSKTASLARFGAYEVRLIEFTVEQSEDGPMLWVELYAHDTRSSLDSFRCDDLDEAVTGADELVARARALHERSRNRRGGAQPTRLP
jgi:hypothetical protein